MQPILDKVKDTVYPPPQTPSQQFFPYFFDLLNGLSLIIGIDFLEMYILL